jgi:large subunit GTPase 1
MSHHSTTLRRQWADYFDSEGIQYAFFSAANATAIQEARRNALVAEREPPQAEQGAFEEEEQRDSNEDVVDNVHEEILKRITPPPDTPLVSDVDSERDDEDEDDYSTESDEFPLMNEGDTEDGQDPRARVLSVLELEDLFTRAAPDLSGMLQLTEIMFIHWI